MTRSFTLAELASRLDCRLDGDGTLVITGVSDLEHAGPGDLSFLAIARYRPAAEHSTAAALIVGDRDEFPGRQLLRHAKPYYAFARALELFHPASRPPAGISPMSAVAADAVIAPDATIGPFVVIASGARIGPRTIVHSHVSIGAEVTIGADCIVNSHVAIRERVTLGDRVLLQAGVVIGSDGFGFTPSPDGRHYKIPQVGVVVIEDDVEIGANSTIDRAAIGETRIRAGTKIDNLVQVGHNVQLGRHVLLAAQVGIGGSATVEDYVMLGGQVGVGGHLTVGKGVMAGGQTGIANSIEPGLRVQGYPAVDARIWRRSSAIFARLPELRRQLLALEQRLRALEAQADGPSPERPDLSG